MLYGIPVVYQYCSCDRNHAKYRTAAAIYQLWIKFIDVRIDRDRNGTEYIFTKKKTLGGSIYECRISCP